MPPTIFDQTSLRLLDLKQSLTKVPSSKTLRKVIAIAFHPGVPTTPHQSRAGGVGMGALREPISLQRNPCVLCISEKLPSSVARLQRKLRPQRKFLIVWPLSQKRSTDYTNHYDMYTWHGRGGSRCTGPAVTTRRYYPTQAFGPQTRCNSKPWAPDTRGTKTRKVLRIAPLASPAQAGFARRPL